MIQSEYRNKWLDRMCAKLHSELPYSLSIGLTVLNRMIVIDNLLGWVEIMIHENVSMPDLMVF